MQAEVKREPALALDGGADGLDFYRRISRDYAAHLNPGGALLMEVGAGQAEDVAAMFPKAEIIKDICGIERVVAVRRMKRLILPHRCFRCLLMAGCAVGAALPAEPEITPSPSPTFSPSPTPSPSPEPEVYRASVGIVGDILMMTSQIQGAKTAEGYDFRPSFYAMEPLFSSVDIMAGNFRMHPCGGGSGLYPKAARRAATNRG